MINMTKCKACGNSPLIGMEVPEVWDGVLYWWCPECGSRQHRFPKGHRLREKADPFVDKEEVDEKG